VPTQSAPAPTEAPAAIALSSPAFVRAGAIPRAFTCDGRDVSPPLRWSGVPAAAVELVLVMRDQDAPGGNFVHWAVAGLSPRTTSLATGAGGAMPPGAVAGRNDFGSDGYRGPCPPRGDRPHRYELTLYALAKRSGVGPGFKFATGTAPLAGALGVGRLTGRYGR
jgi:Raf kinase inhibitor-like YbhB/YbcL family protein